MIYLDNITSGQTVYIPRNESGINPHKSNSYWDGFEDGYESGETHQKNLLTSVTFTENGEYERENGWSAVTVDVPQTGSTAKLEEKTVVISADTTNVTPSSGYDGMSAVTVDASSYAQENYDDGFDDGFTDGYASGSTDEKAKLSAVTFTANTAVTMSDGGYSAVTVNVPQSGGSGINYIEYIGINNPNRNTCYFELGNTGTRLDSKIVIEHSTLSKENTDFEWENWLMFSDTERGRIFVSSSYNGIMFDGRYNNTSISVSSVTDETIILENTGVTIGGVSYNAAYNTSQVSDCNNMTVFCAYGNYFSTPSSQLKYGRIGKISIYDSANTLTYQYKPCLDENNIICFHEVVNDVYVYPNNGGDTYLYSGPVINDMYESGYTDGQNSIISTFSSMTATTNGQYGSSAHPLSSITVNVPQTGSSLNVEANKHYTATSNGNYTITPTSASTTIEDEFYHSQGSSYYKLTATTQGYPSVGTFKLTKVIDSSNPSYGYCEILFKNGVLNYNTAEWYGASVSLNNNVYTFFGASSSYTWTPLEDFTFPYDAMSAVSLNVNVDTASTWESGYTSGETHQKSLLTTTAFTQNGSYQRENGWSGVTVNIDTASTYNSGYTSGYTDGQDNIIGTFSAMTATTNGQYGSSAHPLSAITVEVPQTGTSIPLSSITFTANTSVTVTDKAFTAITVNVPQSGTGRFVHPSIEIKKNRTKTEYIHYYQPSTFYTLEVGLSGNPSKATIEALNYPSTGYFNLYRIGDDSQTYGFIDIYYEDGQIYYDDTEWAGGAITDISSGSTNVLILRIPVSNPTSSEGPDYELPNYYDGMSAITITTNVDTASTYQSGYTSGYTDGYTDGYSSGFTDGNNVSGTTAFTSNGIYTNVSGWSAVTVSVPQGGSSTGTGYMNLGKHKSLGYDAVFIKPNRRIELDMKVKFDQYASVGNENVIFSQYSPENMQYDGGLVLRHMPTNFGVGTYGAFGVILPTTSGTPSVSFQSPDFLLTAGTWYNMAIVCTFTGNTIKVVASIDNVQVANFSTYTTIHSQSTGGSMFTINDPSALTDGIYQFGELAIKTLKVYDTTDNSTVYSINYSSFYNDFI